MSIAMTAPLHDDGVIKYAAHWDEQPTDDRFDAGDLIHWRQAMFTHGLIGEYEDGVAYGNISQRITDSDQFYVSGSATGGLDSINNTHFSRVTRVDVKANSLWCRGPVMASSESMSHAVIYQHCPEINGIIHVHHQTMWQQMMNEVPATPSGVSYGTPEMAQAIIELIDQQQLLDIGVFVMAGHEDGVFSLGSSLQESADRMMSYYESTR